LNAFGLHRKKEEALALILEDNARKNPGKPWISNLQIYVGSGTVLTRNQTGTSKKHPSAADHQLATGDLQYSATKTKYPPSRQGVSQVLAPRRGADSTVHQHVTPR
jgi:hypothetical protein